MPVQSLPGLETEMPITAIDAACKRIPPLWPLQNFVAVNPFLGLTDRTFPDAARLIDAVGHGPMLMAAEYYRTKCQSGAIGEEQIAAAYTDCTGLAAPQQAASWLEAELDRNEESPRVLTVADWIDHARGTNWTGFVTDEISKWCSSYFDRAQSRWAMPRRDESLYRAWKHAASIDLNPEVYGLRGFRSLVRALPECDEAAIRQLLFLLDVPGEEVEDFLHRQLMSIFGWSAWSVYRERQAAGENLPVNCWQFDWPMMLRCWQLARDTMPAARIPPLPLSQPQNISLKWQRRGLSVRPWRPGLPQHPPGNRGSQEGGCKRCSALMSVQRDTAERLRRRPRGSKPSALRASSVWPWNSGIPRFARC